ncbi:MAG: TolC family protein [Dysgonomonas sp.]
MRKIFIIFCTLIFCHGYSFAQLTIENCYEKAKANYPLIKQYGLIEKSKEYNLSNAGKNYLPQLSLSAKASYQSDVTEIPISIPGLKGLAKDQYSVSLDLNQTIWDGGVTHSKKALANAAADISRNQLDVDLYALNDRVNQLYFGILLLDAYLQQNKLLQEELQWNNDKISSYIANGVANQSDLDAIRVEQLKAAQNKAGLLSNRKAYLAVLSSLIGEQLTDSVYLEKPVFQDVSSIININRLELNLFDAQNNNLEMQKKMLNANNMPKIGFFITGGYGRPGLNMLNSEFDAYYIGGLKLSWNFGSLYTKKNDIHLIEMNQRALSAQKETFLFNTNLTLTQEQNTIQKQQDLLKYDDEIITLRTNVKNASEAKVANGTISVTDLMRDVIDEDLAKQSKMQHEIELLQSLYNLKYITNN